MRMQDAPMLLTVSLMKIPRENLTEFLVSGFEYQADYNGKANPVLLDARLRALTKSFVPVPITPPPAETEHPPINGQGASTSFGNMQFGTAGEIGSTPAPLTFGQVESSGLEHVHGVGTAGTNDAVDVEDSTTEVVEGDSIPSAQSVQQEWVEVKAEDGEIPPQVQRFPCQTSLSDADDWLMTRLVLLKILLPWTGLLTTWKMNCLLSIPSTPNSVLRVRPLRSPTLLLRMLLRWRQLLRLRPPIRPKPPPKSSKRKLRMKLRGHQRRRPRRKVRTSGLHLAH